MPTDRAETVQPESILRGKYKAALEQLGRELHQLDESLTVEALGNLQKHGLYQTYSHIWQELEALLEAANSMPLESLERDSRQVAVELEGFLKRLHELGMLTD